MIRVSVRIPEELRKRLREYCRREKRSASEVARDSLRRHLGLQEFRAIRRKLVPLAKARGIRTDEDIFRLVS